MNLPCVSRLLNIIIMSLLMCYNSFCFTLKQFSDCFSSLNKKGDNFVRLNESPEKEKVLSGFQTFQFVCHWWTTQPSETHHNRTKWRIIEHRHIKSLETGNISLFLLQKGNAGLWLLCSDSGSFPSSGLQQNQSRSPAGAGQQHHRETQMSVQLSLFCFLFFSPTRNNSLRN